MICNVSSLFPKWDDADTKVCVVDYCMDIMHIAKSESCGKCVLCREGTWQVHEIIRDITECNAKSDDLELLQDLLEQIKENASCEMSRTAATICMDLMKRYEEEWGLHIRRKRCSNLVCKGTYTLFVDPMVCDGCGKCLESCPQGAIAGNEGMIHVINTDICNKSMVCMSVCPTGAIKKAGSIKPKLPVEPVLVGSFGQSSTGEENDGGRRRRRR